MVLLADDRELVLPDPYNGGDHPNLEVGSLKRVALLDMRLEEGDVARWINEMTWAASPTRGCQRVAHRNVGGAIDCAIDFALFQHANKRTAAEEAAKMAFLVAEDGDVNTEVLCRRILRNGPGGFQRINATKRPIEPPGMVLAFKMRSRESLATARTALAEDVGNAVDLGIEPCLTHPGREPLPRGDVRSGQGGTVHAGLVSAEGCEGFQVR